MTMMMEKWMCEIYNKKNNHGRINCPNFENKDGQKFPSLVSYLQLMLCLIVFSTTC
eukprot:m.254304 g.254304  ORF g.254304 m.254304 type:complete len:56 (+) comp16170_c2_seq1:2480-2647(+)